MSAADTVAKTTPIGIHAVAQHMIDRQLPGPWGIDAPSRCTGHDAIRISIPSTALTAWATSIHIDTETHTPAKVPGFTQSTYAGRLPDTGVRVCLEVVTRTDEHGLRLVTA